MGLVATGLIFFGYDFIVGFWAGPGYEDSYWVALLLILPVTIELIQTVGIDVQRALNRHKFRSIAYLIMSVVNVILTVYLGKRYGAIGAAIGTAVSVFVVDGVIINIYYHKKCNLNVIAFWKNIIRISVGIIPPCLFGCLLNRFLPSMNVWIYLLKIVLYTVVYLCSLWCLSFTKIERINILSYIKKHKKAFKIKNKNIKQRFLQMKKKYCGVEINISDNNDDDFLMSSPGVTVLTDDDREDNTAIDIFSGWWM